MSVRIAVLASGGGSNLQALLDHFVDDANTSIQLVISDRADAGALRRARNAGVTAEHVGVRDRSADDVAGQMLELFRHHDIHMIALAGYLRLIPAEVTEQFRSRIVNIHPALLPAFGGRGMYGRHVHEAVLAAGCTVTGATVHWVDERYDEGRIIAQWPVPVLPDDSAETLAARVLAVEHRLYPAALAAVAARIRPGERGSGGAGERAAGVAPRGDAVYRLGSSLEGIEDEIIAIADL